MVSAGEGRGTAALGAQGTGHWDRVRELGETLHKERRAHRSAWLSVPGPTDAFNSLGEPAPLPNQLKKHTASDWGGTGGLRVRQLYTSLG